jgi:hypothetical protein
MSQTMKFNPNQRKLTEYGLAGALATVAAFMAVKPYTALISLSSSKCIVPVPYLLP